MPSTLSLSSPHLYIDFMNLLNFESPKFLRGLLNSLNALFICQCGCVYSSLCILKIINTEHILVIFSL